jgi:Peptidase family M20/M25/M40
MGGQAASDIHDFLASNRDQLIEELIGWVRLRSVAGLPERAADLIRSANWLAGTLRATGFPTVEVWRRDGAPAVYAQWCAAPDAPTVLIYSHHDVRAAKDEQWEETPFEPTVRDGHVYGRGTSDAKGQVLSHIWGCVRISRSPAGTPRGEPEDAGGGRGGDGLVAPGRPAGGEPRAVGRRSGGLLRHADVARRSPCRLHQHA